MELRLDRLLWYGRISALLLVALAGFVVFHVYWVVPVREDIVLGERDLTQLQMEINEALRIASQLREVETDVDDLTERLESLAAALPQERDVWAVLRRLQTLAAQSNLSIRSFTPQAVDRQELHAAWPIRLELHGTYHNLGGFFDRVSKCSQVIAINDVDVLAIDAPQLNATIKAECAATISVLHDEATEAA
jgi:type IV pilus assembly protein PilO